MDAEPWPPAAGALEVDVHVPNVDGAPAAVVVVVPSDDVVRLALVEPSLDVLAELLVMERPSAPNGPVLHARRHEVRELVRLHEDVQVLQHVLVDVSLPVTAIGPVHPCEPGVLLPRHLVVALPRPNFDGAPGAPGAGWRPRARRRLAVAIVAGANGARPRSGRGVTPEVPLCPVELASALGPVLQPLHRVRLFAQLVEALLHHLRLVHDHALRAPLPARAPVAVPEQCDLHGHVDPKELCCVARLARRGDASAQPSRVRTTGVEHEIRLPRVSHSVVEGVDRSAHAPAVYLLVRLFAHVPGKARVSRLEAVGLDVEVAPMHPPALDRGLPRSGQPHEE
mmetsp:Transcript_2346/g.6754  ORF Transcript_2346/g.6754 Transcript_2346/m.6754 type:complete len:339 (+) Transcript_2346:465-1481(+)